MMFRNLPRSFTSDHMIKELEAIVPQGSFDFVYLPWDTKPGHPLVTDPGYNNRPWLEIIARLLLKFPVSVKLSCLVTLE